MIINEKNMIEINGTFHIKGFAVPIIATKEYTKIAVAICSHNTKIGGGTGIVLTPNSIGF